MQVKEKIKAMSDHHWSEKALTRLGGDRRLEF